MRLRLLPPAVLTAMTIAAAPALADGGPIMPLSDVQPGMDCTGETVIQGTAISSFNVHVIGVVRGVQSEPAILVSVSGPAVDTTGVAEGFSGSPVYCPMPGGGIANAGAIAMSVGEYGNKKVLVTPIQLMLGEPVRPPSSAPRLKARTHSLMGPLTVGGLSPSLFDALWGAERRAGRVVLAAPAAPFLAFGVQPLVPGAAVAVSYSSGAISFGGVGTVTYRKGAFVYAFGHELDGAGRRSLLLQDAYVYDVINDPNPSIVTSYKLASPGHLEGTLTADTPNAVVGVVGGHPATIPIAVTARNGDTGRVQVERTQVADETDVGFPLGTSLIDVIAPLALGQAGIDVFDGPPAAESGRMCFKLALRESRTPLGFCNRYVGVGAPGDAGFAPPEVASGASTDITLALALLDEQQFANLHVTGITANLEAQAGLAEGEILRAIGPHRARAGSTIQVALRVQMYRGAVHPYVFELRIPRRSSGHVTVTLRGPSFTANPNFGGGLGGSLSSLLSLSLGGGPPVGAAPADLAALRKAIAGIPSYDGVTASFGPHSSEHAYRDPDVLLTGQAKLRLTIVR